MCPNRDTIYNMTINELLFKAFLIKNNPLIKLCQCDGVEVVPSRDETLVVCVPNSIMDQLGADDWLEDMFDTGLVFDNMTMGNNTYIKLYF